MRSYLLLIGPPVSWGDFDISRIEWLPGQCTVAYGQASTEAVRIVPSGVGPSFQVILPEGIFERIGATDTLELRLRDTKGNDWQVRPFFPFRRLLEMSPLASQAKLMADYGDEEA